MASVTMAATTSFLSTNMAKRRGVIVAKAPSKAEEEKVSIEMNNRGEESSNGRRNLVFAAATVAACSVAKIAVAVDEPKPGTPEAKKKYAPVCVTMPTARICKK